MKTFGCSMSVVLRLKRHALVVEPLAKPLWIQKLRWNCAALNEPILDRQPAPVPQQLVTHAIGTSSPLANGDAPLQPSRHFRFGTHNYVRHASLGLSRVGVVAPMLGTHPRDWDDLLHHVE